MRIFVLEDDIECNPFITYLRDGGHEVIHAKTIEAAVTYLDYEEGIKQCDKLIFDAALPAAEVIYMDDSEQDYYGVFNGIDLLCDNIEKWGIRDSNKAVILTAYEYNLKEYNRYLDIADDVKIISKNSNNFINDINDFLEK